MREGRDEGADSYSDSGRDEGADSYSAPSPSASPALRKVVLARRTTLSLAEPVDALSLVASLRARDPDAYQFALVHPTGAAFVGSTPERLFSARDGHAASEAVAGTRPAAPTRARTRLWRTRCYSRRKNTRVCHRSRGGAPRVGGRRRGWFPRRSRRAREGRASARLRAASLRAIGRAISGGAVRSGRPRGVTPDARGVRIPARRRARRRAPRGDVRPGIIRRPDGLGRRRLGGVCRRDSIDAGQTGRRGVTRYAGVGVVAAADSAAEWHELKGKTRGGRSARRPSLAEAPNAGRAWAYDARR